MWRFVVVALLLAGLGLYAFKKKTTPVAEADQISEYQYAEARVSLHVNGRELEMVAIREKPTAGECSGTDGPQFVKDFCKAGGPQCKLVSSECTNTLQQRYIKMLAKQPVSVPYTHFTIPRDSTEHKLVFVGWGLTVDESNLICQGMKRHQVRDIKVACIANKE